MIGQISLFDLFGPSNKLKMKIQNLFGIIIFWCNFWQWGVRCKENPRKKLHFCNKSWNIDPGTAFKNASIVWNFWGKWKKPKYVVIFGYVKEMFVLKSPAAFPTLLRVRACAWVSSFLTSSRKKELRPCDDGWEANKQQAADMFRVSRIYEGFLP